MKRIASAVMALLLTLLATGCDWRDVGIGLLALRGGIIIIDDRDTGDCDEWYDFGDPGCW